MSIATPVSTVLLVLFGLSAAVTITMALVVAAVLFFVKNHQVRTARREPMGAYYGRVLLGR